ncbi:MAG TPA: hypothetical protein VMW32_09265 [Bacteroidales bacterium]|nr:hypothetical protein [Bacteroidales bacterium]
MKAEEIKELLIRSLDENADAGEAARRLEEEGAVFSFSKGFTDKILERLYTSGSAASKELEFLRNLNSAFYRIALTGVAAIVILLISIFLMEGSFSFNSFLGMSDSYDESIIYLLTGN